MPDATVPTARPPADEELSMITELALLALFAIHGAVLAASTRRRRLALIAPGTRQVTVVRPGSGRPTAAHPVAEHDPPAPIDLAAYRRRRQERHAVDRASARRVHAPSGAATRATLRRAGES